MVGLPSWSVSSSVLSRYKMYMSTCVPVLSVCQWLVWKSMAIFVCSFTITNKVFRVNFGCPSAACLHSPGRVVKGMDIVKKSASDPKHSRCLTVLSSLSAVKLASGIGSDWTIPGHPRPFGIRLRRCPRAPACATLQAKRMSPTPPARGRSRRAGALMTARASAPPFASSHVHLPMVGNTHFSITGLIFAWNNPTPSFLPSGGGRGRQCGGQTILWHGHGGGHPGSENSHSCG